MIRPVLSFLLLALPACASSPGTGPSACGPRSGVDYLVELDATATDPDCPLVDDYVRAGGDTLALDGCALSWTEWETTHACLERARWVCESEAGPVVYYARLDWSAPSEGADAGIEVLATGTLHAYRADLDDPEAGCGAVYDVTVTRAP